MIIKPNNWDSIQEFTDRKQLPLDAYVCRIRKAEVQGEALCVLFDISEGEYTGYYAEEFKANTFENKKYKGILRVWLPKDDGSDKDEMTKRIFKGFVTAVERSNPGYHWNWEENSLAGRTVGIIMRNEEWDYNGKHGWAVRPFRATTADKIREGNYELPKDKPLANRPVESYDGGYGADYGGGFETMEDDDDELPF